MPSPGVQTFVILLACATLSACAFQEMTKEEIKAFVQTQIDGSTKRIDEITRALSRPDQGFDKQGYPINRIDSGALPNEYWQRAKDYESIGEHQHAKEDYDT